MMIKLKNKLKIFKTIQKYFVYFLIFLLSQSCDKKEGSFLTELPFENLVVITSGNGSHRGITAYDLGGNFVRSIGDFRLTGGLPRGTIYVGSERFLVVQDGPDKIDYLTFSGNQSPFYGSNFFSGATYDLAQDSRGNVYATESSNIEKFSPDGSRLPLSTGNAFIQGSVGACTISNARDLYITEDDILIIASFTNGNIIRVDVSTDTPVCLSSVNVGTQVHSAFLHSNGSLYYSRLTTDEIYRANPDGSGGVVPHSNG